MRVLVRNSDLLLIGGTATALTDGLSKATGNDKEDLGKTVLSFEMPSGEKVSRTATVQIRGRKKHVLFRLNDGTETYVRVPFEFEITPGSNYRFLLASGSQGHLELVGASEEAGARRFRLPTRFERRRYPFLYLMLAASIGCLWWGAIKVFNDLQGTGLQGNSTIPIALAAGALFLGHVLGGRQRSKRTNSLSKALAELEIG